MNDRVPASIDAAGSELAGLDGLITATEWKRAAIVFAFTKPGQAGRPPKNRAETRPFSRLSFREFAAKGFAGLSDRHTVAQYWHQWQWAIDQDEADAVSPGDAYQEPDIYWHDQTGFFPEIELWEDEDDDDEDSSGDKEEGEAEAEGNTETITKKPKAASPKATNDRKNREVRAAKAKEESTASVTHTWIRRMHAAAREVARNEAMWPHINQTDIQRISETIDAIETIRKGLLRCKNKSQDRNSSRSETSPGQRRRSTKFA